ncbi:hypothetical protein GA830_01740 [Mesorhizobium sp. NBSH29]|uniref:hypothetical protein n=1 Tax=Mesorhizobium sp. NBSH29 TaxID=2654249 RepID=UPI00189674F4|nr:hypothetical protein [Mesorhizobium sp. NBSH29]QPC85603.1 hypothetical protein GA830_01740 [Mesorhizobium sp. NBSH29]
MAGAKFRGGRSAWLDRWCEDDPAIWKCVPQAAHCFVPIVATPLVGERIGARANTHQIIIGAEVSGWVKALSAVGEGGCGEMDKGSVSNLPVNGHKCPGGQTAAMVRDRLLGDAVFNQIAERSWY